MRYWEWSGKPGYDLHDALRYCAGFQPKSYLEIGVDGGASLNTVLDVCRPDRIVLCDIWDVGYCNHGLDSHQHLYPHLEWRNLLEATTFLDGDSKILIPQHCQGMHFDLITVDGDHSKLGAHADLKHCWPLLTSGGHLVFDDVTHHVFAHLQQVFCQFLAKNDDAMIVPEKTAVMRNCVVVRKL